MRPTAANHEFGTEFYHAHTHGLAESGAAPSDQYAFSLKQIGLKHSGFPCLQTVDIPAHPRDFRFTPRKRTFVSAVIL
jgi:hypothetical protein